MKKDDYIMENQCAGCEKTVKNHNGRYVKINYWVKGQTITFVDVIFKK